MPMVLRFLRSVAYNNDETYGLLTRYVNWRGQKLPLAVNDKLVNIIVPFPSPKP